MQVNTIEAPPVTEWQRKQEAIEATAKMLERIASGQSIRLKRREGTLARWRRRFGWR